MTIRTFMPSKDVFDLSNLTRRKPSIKTKRKNPRHKAPMQKKSVLHHGSVMSINPYTFGNPISLGH